MQFQLQKISYIEEIFLNIVQEGSSETVPCAVRLLVTQIS